MSLISILKNVGIGLTLVSSLYSCTPDISCNEGRRYVEGKGCVDDEQDAGTTQDSFVEKDNYVPPQDTYTPIDTFVEEDSHIPEKDTSVEQDTYTPPKDTYVCKKKEFFKDNDGDKFGSDFSKMLCEPEGKYTSLNNKDCDDNDKNVNPNSKEVCNDKDDDCNGKTDEDFTNLNEKCTVGLGECKKIGQKICSQDSLDTICNVSPGKPNQEICNNKDDDCNGKTDEDLKQSCKTDCGTGLENCISGEWKNCNAKTECEKIVAVCDNYKLHITNPEGSSWKKLNSQDISFWPSWSPNKKKIVYVSTKSFTSKVNSIYVHDIDTDKSIKLSQLFNKYDNCVSTSWSFKDKIVVSCVSPAGNKDEFKDLFIVDLNGKIENITNSSKINAWTPSWSPKEEKIVFFDAYAYSINIIDKAGKDLGKVYNYKDEVCIEPNWSSKDVVALICYKNLDSLFELHTVELNGQNKKMVFKDNKYDISEPSWSPNSENLVFSKRDRKSNPGYSITQGIFIYDLKNKTTKKIPNQPNYCQHPDWSKK